MNSACQLPFFAPESRLPSSLPSPQDIEHFAVVLHEQTGRRVVRFGDCFVIKYGLNVSLTEGENMLFVRQTQSEAIPEVFALFSVLNREDRPVNYIIMEHIVGERLDTIWPRLDQTEKDRTAHALRLSLDTVRNIPAQGYFGCIGRRPFEESMFWTAPEDGLDDGTINGPFDTESNLNDALVRKYLYNTGLNQKARYYRRVLPLVLRGHSMVFTHGDLQRKNIIMRENGKPVLIDWETAGWYPAYWEYASAVFACGSWQDDWHEYVPRILDEYPNEYAWFDMLRRELWS